MILRKKMTKQIILGFILFGIGLTGCVTKNGTPASASGTETFGTGTSAVDTNLKLHDTRKYTKHRLAERRAVHRATKISRIRSI